MVRPSPAGWALAVKPNRKHKMKISDAVKAFEAGEPLLVVEYRGTAVAEVGYTDKKTGNRIGSVTVEHHLEAGIEPLHVCEYLPDGVSLQEVEADTKLFAPFKKGQRCVLRVENLRRKAGRLAGRGKLEAIED